MRSRGRGQGSIGRRLRLWTLVLFCLVVEATALTVQARTQYVGNIPWFEKLVVALRTGHDVVPANDGPPDYRMFRSVAELTAQRRTAELYDPVRFGRFEEGVGMKSDSWIYAPTVIPITVLARFGDFGRGFLIWTALLTLISVLVLRGAGIPWLVAGATLLSPAVVWNLYLGQLGLIAGALFVASLVWTTNRPTASGIAAGLLTMKPQAGLLLPVVYIARARFRAILAAVVMFATLVALSLSLYGPGIWMAYLHQGLATAHKILLLPFPTVNEAFGASIFWMARGFGLGVTGSYVAQAAGAMIAGLWCWIAWRDPGAAPWPRIALTTCLATFVTPYGYVDDLCAFSLGIALLAWHRGRVRPADMLFWTWPAFAFISVLTLHVLITPLVILGAAIYAHAEMKRDAPGRRRLEQVLRDAALPPD